MTIDPMRREYLTDKYPVVTRTEPMNPISSTQVRATDRAEAIIGRVWFEGRDGAALFDPVLCPPMAERAEAVAAELRGMVAEDRVRFDTADTDHNPADPAEQGVTRIWFVGSSIVEIVRERWRDHPNRKFKPVDWFGGDLGNQRRDYKAELDCDTTCNVHIARACGGPTRILAADRGTLVLLFRCCRKCEALAGDIANNNRALAITEARAKLPAGAIIISNPPVPTL